MGPGMRTDTYADWLVSRERSAGSREDISRTDSNLVKKNHAERANGPRSNERRAVRVVGLTGFEPMTS